jgi:predicted nucleic acid-binding protein
VLDASFAVNWAIGVQGSQIDRALSDAEKAGGLAAPVIFWHEVASALRTLCFRAVLDKIERDAALVRLQGIGIVVERRPPPIAQVVQVADRFSLTIYDAAYLDFALRLDATLATDDAALLASAERSRLRLIRSS